jgi:hypothetical protein
VASDGPPRSGGEPGRAGPAAGLPVGLEPLPDVGRELHEGNLCLGGKHVNAAEGECTVGDKGKRDKDKSQKQKNKKDKDEARRKKDKEPKRPGT